MENLNADELIRKVLKLKNEHGNMDITLTDLNGNLNRVIDVRLEDFEDENEKICGHTIDLVVEAINDENECNFVNLMKSKSITYIE